MRVVLLLMAFLVASCAMPQADPARVAQARQAYEWVRDGDQAALATAATPTLRSQLTPEAMTALRSYTVAGEPDASRVISWRATIAAGRPATYEVVQQFDYPQKHVLVAVLMARSADGGRWAIDGVHFNTIDPTAAKAVAGFSLQGKSPVHYGVLAGVVLAPLICLVTTGVAAWRRRWGWMIFSLFGFGQIALNWSSGEWQFNALQFSVLSAGFVKGIGPLDPWILMLSFPVPAILFWVLRRYRPKPPPRKKGQPAQNPDADA